VASQPVDKPVVKQQPSTPVQSGVPHNTAFPTASMSNLFQRAESGDTEAMRELAAKYTAGNGVERDAEYAEQLINEAIQREDAIKAVNEAAMTRLREKQSERTKEFTKGAATIAFLVPGVPAFLYAWGVSIAQQGCLGLILGPVIGILIAGIFGVPVAIIVAIIAFIISNLSHLHKTPEVSNVSVDDTVKSLIKQLVKWEEVRKANSSREYHYFLNNYERNLTHQQQNRITDCIWMQVVEANQPGEYDWFVRTSTRAGQCNVAYKKLFELTTQEGHIGTYVQYYDRYPNSPLRNQALGEVFDLVKKENRIDRYVWFITKYSDSPLAGGAYMLMTAEGFRLVKAHNTIETYNEFIRTFPGSKQVKEANQLALNLEKREYGTGNRAEDSRALLIRLKQISLQRRRANANEQHGYLSIEERMSKLLQDEFPREEATLRYLESEEFKDYSTMLARVMKDGFLEIQAELTNIHQSISFGNQIAAIGVQLSHEIQIFLQQQANEERIRFMMDMQLRDSQHQELIQSANEQKELNKQLLQEQTMQRKMISNQR